MLLKACLMYIPEGFGWRGTTFRKYRAVAEHNDHEQPNNNNSTRFHTHVQGITLQPFPTLTLIWISGGLWRSGKVCKHVWMQILISIPILVLILIPILIPIPVLILIPIPIQTNQTHQNNQTHIIKRRRTPILHSLFKGPAECAKRLNNSIWKWNYFEKTQTNKCLEWFNIGLN